MFNIRNTVTAKTANFKIIITATNTKKIIVSLDFGSEMCTNTKQFLLQNFRQSHIHKDQED